jgi:XTP/dITP diphosphohydrolase
MELVIASKNTEKVRELRSLLKELMPELTVRSLIEFPDFKEGKKRSKTFEENSLEKAVYAAKELQRPCIADDSGLVIPSFGDSKESMKRKEKQPKGTRLPDTKKLLGDLGPEEEKDRSAFLECALSFATPDKGHIKTVSARMEGTIATREKGPASFDFTSLFMKNDYSKTLAELPPSVLSRISHRRKALEKLFPFLRSYFSSTT